MSRFVLYVIICLAAMVAPVLAQDMGSTPAATKSCGETAGIPSKGIFRLITLVVRGDTMQVQCDPNGQWVDHFPPGMSVDVLTAMVLLRVFAPIFQDLGGDPIDRFVIIEADESGEDYAAEMRKRLGPPLTPHEYVVIRKR